MTNKIKLYTFYSDTHRSLLLDYFLESFYRLKLEESFELIIHKVSQKSESGDFNSNGFRETMGDKLRIIKTAIEDNPGEKFVFSDCDVQFLSNFHDDILSYGDYDILAQSDVGTICAGFFMGTANERLSKFIDTVHADLDRFPNDQVGMNHYRSMISYKLLPIDKYLSVGNLNGGKVWNGGNRVDFSGNRGLVHHANFTIGVENKRKLFNLVKNEFQSN